MGRHLDQVTKAEIADIYSRGGCDVGEICREYEISTARVYEILKELGVPLRGKNSLLARMGDEEIEAFVSDYNSDMPLREVSVKYKFSSPAVIHAIVKQLGLVPRTWAKERLVGRETMIQSAIQMYIDGAPIWKIVQTTGLDQPSLHHHLHVRGIETRREKLLREKLEKAKV